MAVKPILLDETGKDLVSAIDGIKQVLSPSQAIEISENGVYDISDKGRAIVGVRFPSKVTGAITAVLPAVYLNPITIETPPINSTISTRITLEEQ